jgi:hypothetical protein
MRRLCLALLLLLPAGPGLAGDSAVISASRFSDLPPGKAVNVQVYDDSDMNLRVREAFVQALQVRGVTVVAGAPLELMLDLTVQEGRLEITQPSLGRASSNVSDSRVELNVLSNTEDSVLGGRRSEPGTRVVREGIVSLNAQLNDPEARETLWQGDVRTEMDRRGLEGLAERMVEPLADSYGRNVANEEVRLAQ